MNIEFCDYCGKELSEENIRLAREDAKLRRDELIFYCPSYDNHELYHVIYDSIHNNYEVFHSLEDAEYARDELEIDCGLGTVVIEEVESSDKFCLYHNEADRTLPAKWKIK